MNWNFNINEAPKGEIIKQPITRKGKPAFYSYSTAPKIISASSCGRVFTTRWLPESGRWEGYSKNTGPIAWQPYPVHPKEMQL